MIAFVSESTRLVLLTFKIVIARQYVVSTQAIMGKIKGNLYHIYLLVSYFTVATAVLMSVSGQSTKPRERR